VVHPVRFSGGQTHHFSRRSLWSEDHLLHTDAGVAGLVRRTNFWGTEIAADLPGLPLPVQVFVLATLITLWNAQALVVTYALLVVADYVSVFSGG
jgi:hypothetical protein